MRKYVMISFILLVILLFSACSGQNSAPESNSPGDAAQNQPSGDTAKTETASAEQSAPAGQIKVTVSAPDGWEPGEGIGFLLRYSKQGASFMLKEEPYGSSTLDEVVSDSKEIFEGTFDNVEYVGGVEDLTVGGKDAKKYTFTCEVSGFKMKYQYVFFFVDRDVYVITCGCSEEIFDSFAADFESLINSVHFE